VNGNEKYNVSAIVPRIPQREIKTITDFLIEISLVFFGC